MADGFSSVAPLARSEESEEISAEDAVAVRASGAMLNHALSFHKTLRMFLDAPQKLHFGRGNVASQVLHWVGIISIFGKCKAPELLGCWNIF